MSQGEELLDSLVEEGSTPDTVESTAEPHIVINSDRTIAVPAALKRIAVQYDHNIETVTFDCPRYWDEHDMSTMKAQINYMRSDGVLDSYIVKELKVDENDDTLMHFDWTISRNVTEVKGNLAILVCIKKSDTDGNETNHWNSELCKELYVSEGMEVDPWSSGEEEGGSGGATSDLVAGLLERMDELEIIGLSTVIDVTEIEGGHRVTITSTDGIKKFDVFSSIIRPAKIDGGHRLTIKDSEGTKTLDVMDGVDGADGAVFTPVVSSNGDLSWTNNGGLENPSKVNLRGPKGERGVAGAIFTKVALSGGSATLDPLGPYRIDSDATELVLSLMTENIEHPSSKSLRLNEKIYQVDSAGTMSVFDINTKITTTLSITCPLYSNMVLVNGQIYIMGSLSPSGVGSSDRNMYIFDPVTETTSTVATLPTGYFALVGLNDHMVAYGTKIYGFPAYKQNPFWVFDTSSNTFSMLSVSSPYGYGIGQQSVEVVGNKIYFLGGKRYNMQTFHRTVAIFDIETETFSVISEGINVGRASAGSLVVDTKIYLFGGQNSVYSGSTKDPLYTDTIEVFDTATETSTILSASLPVIETAIGITTNTADVLATIIDDEIRLFMSGNEYKLANSIIVNLTLEYTGGAYTFPINAYDEYYNYFYFEILALQINDSRTKLTIVYEVNRVRYVHAVTGANLDISDCKLVISNANEVLKYNTEYDANDDILGAISDRIDANTQLIEANNASVAVNIQDIRTDQAAQNELIEANTDGIDALEVEQNIQNKHIDLIMNAAAQCGLFYKDDNEETFLTRKTANGMNIVDPSPAIVKKIQGNSFKSKNLLNVAGRTRGGDGWEYGNTSTRNFSEAEYYVGLTCNNWYDPSSVPTATISTDSLLAASAAGGYGVGFPVRCLPNTTYTFSKISDTDKGCIGYGFYTRDGSYISCAGGGVADTVTFTTPSDACWVCIVLGTNPADGTVTKFSNIMLNEGTEALPYERGLIGVLNTSFQGIESCSSNLLPYPYETSPGTKEGLTFSYADDGIITVKGAKTSTGNVAFLLHEACKLAPGTYTVHDEGMTNPDIRFMFQEYVNGNWVTNHQLFSVDEKMTLVVPNDSNSANRSYRVAYIVTGNSTLNLTLKPTINLGDAIISFKPYKKTEYSLAEPVNLAKWDYMLPQEGKIVRRSYTHVFTGDKEEFVGGPIDTTNTGWAGVDTCGFYIYCKGSQHALGSGTYLPAIGRSNDTDIVGSGLPCVRSGYSYTNVGMGFNNDYFYIRVPRALLAAYGSDNSSATVNINALKAWLKERYEGGNPIMVTYKAKNESDITTETIECEYIYESYAEGVETAILRNSEGQVVYYAAPTITNEYCILPDTTGDGTIVCPASDEDIEKMFD